MAYEITAARKRPRSFEELAGQEFVSTTLKASLESGRIAHSYLFSGPRGCGKTSTARILAKSLNCEKGPTSKPCGVCGSCESIQRGSALDVIEIDGASNTSVDNVRQIKDEILFPPTSGRYKIYIIDEVHMLSNSAFNALLKTIEEPPPYIVFIFATTELHKVPATIKSRCQQFNFRLIPLDVIRRLLREAASELSVEADEEALLWIAKAATGSLRDAYTLFDQAASFSDGKITYEKVRDKLGLVGVDRMNALFEACVRGERTTALEWVDDILSRGVSPEQCVADAAEYVRSLLLVKNGVSRESVLGDIPAKFSSEVVDSLTTERIERAFAEILDLHRALRYSVDPRLELELAAARLCSIRDWISPAEAARAVDELRAWTLSGAAAEPGAEAAREAREAAGEEGAAESRPARAEKKNGDANLNPRPSVPETPVAAGPPAASPGIRDPQALRQAVLASLGKTHMVLSSALQNSLSWSVQENRLEILFRGAYEETMTRQDLPTLVKAVGELSGRSLRVELKTAEQEPAAAKPGDEAAEETDVSGGDPAVIVERVFRGTRVEPEAPKPRSGEANGYF